MVRSTFEHSWRLAARAAVLTALVLALAPAVLPADSARAGSAEPLSVAAGQSVVLEMPHEVSTV